MARGVLQVTSKRTLEIDANVCIHSNTGRCTVLTLLQAAAESSIIGILMPFVIMFAVFYFLLLRPQQAQQKKRREMLGSLRRGDKVVTVGGIHGEITAIKDDDITLKIADNVEIKITRAGVGQKKGSEGS